MAKILCTYEEYNNLEIIFSHMNWKNYDYVPTKEEIDNLILPNLPKYIVFLLWIDITGVSTPGNKEIRRYIKKILRENLELVEKIPKKGKK